MTALLQPHWPELLLTAVACVLFLLGASPSAGVRRFVPMLAAGTLLAVVGGLLWFGDELGRGEQFAGYIKLLSAAVGILFVLLSWPTNPKFTGNIALDVGTEVGEYFALMLLAIAGIFLVADAEDIILLFLGIELASIPTYIMVSISRPLPVAQEAGLKYFFLGAMAAALMLFGFSYLYGATGSIRLVEIRQMFHPGLGEGESAWQLLAIVVLLLGFAFKLAAVPLHSYAGDVYQGAATPMTALLAFVPKTAGIVAVIKILVVASGPVTPAGPSWDTPAVIVKLLWVIAVLTMTFGNVLGLLQQNIKRIFAYSSVAHSGYMLVALTALIAARGTHLSPEKITLQSQAISAVLFYLCAYGIMNTGAFGVLMLLPGRTDTHGRHDAEGHALPTASSAETLEDISGKGRQHVALGLAMAVCCFSLTGLPMTIGFLGKVLLIQPAFAIWKAGDNPFGELMIWLVVLTMINAAISATYYLKIVAFMFLRSEHGDSPTPVPYSYPKPLFFSWPVTAAVVFSVAGTLFFGIVLPGTTSLTNQVEAAAKEIGEDSKVPMTSTPVPAPAATPVATAAR